MKKLCLLLILVTWVISGCSQVQQEYALNMATVTSYVVDLKMQYSQVEKVIDGISDKVTPEQAMTIKVSKIKFRDLIKKLEGISRLENYRISTYEMSYMWNTVISERDKIKEDVVRPNWEKFDISEQYILRLFDDKITATDSEIKQLISNPTHDNLSKALDLMSAGLLLGVKILGVGAAVL